MPEPWPFDVWPAHPAPEPGECLTSYLLRLAEANGGARVWDLVQDAFPTRTHVEHLRVLRWEYPVDAWGRLPLRAQRTPAELERLTVLPWVAKFRLPLPIGAPGNRSPASVVSGVIAPGLQVCPCCLAERPLVPLLWRLVAVEACLVHGCWLQARCPGCAQPLPVIRAAQRPGCCGRCGADLRAAPVVPADPAALARQQRRQVALTWLLDPGVTLVPAVAGTLAASLPQRVGARLQAVRMQAGWSVAALAQQLAVPPTTIGELERGQRAAAVPLYLAYLETLDLTWPTVAALPMPETSAPDAEPAQLALRRCPTPTCAHHAVPSATGVIRMIDLPDRQVARFRCKGCGRTFTRGYDGTLQQKPRRPPIQPGDPPPVPKPAEAVARLVALGRLGLPNRQIAQQLGWGEKTVRSYWIALRLEEEVHQAQARRRRDAVQQHHAQLRGQVEAILGALQQEERVITLRRVAQALGRNADYLQTVPELTTLVRTVAARHNDGRRHVKAERLDARVTQALERVLGAADPPSLRAVAQQVGLDRERFQAAHPAIYARAREAVDAERAARRAARHRQRLARIDAAARSLVAQGRPLTYTGLLAAAGVDRYYGFRDPRIHDRLEQWVGDPRPGD